MNWKTLPTPPRLATVLSVALLVGASAAAQVRNAPVVPTTGCGSGTSNPNIPSLEVRVVMSVGQPVKSEQIRVQVTSESGVPVAQAFTNARGGLALLSALLQLDCLQFLPQGQRPRYRNHLHGHPPAYQ